MLLSLNKVSFFLFFFSLLKFMNHIHVYLFIDLKNENVSEQKQFDPYACACVSDSVCMNSCALRLCFQLFVDNSPYS